MKNDYMLHIIWLLLFCWVAIVLSRVPFSVKVSSQSETVAYQTVGMLRLNNNPYLMIPVYVANKDMRAYYLMKSADEVMAQYKNIVQLPKGNQ